jgi:hypothetical protein
MGFRNLYQLGKCFVSNNWRSSTFKWNFRAI